MEHPTFHYYKVGAFTHWALYRFLANELGGHDVGYTEEFKRGLPVVGPVARSGRWPLLHNGGVPETTPEDLQRGAWAQRRKTMKATEEQAQDDATTRR